MTPAEIGALFVERFGAAADDQPGVTVEESYGASTIDVPNGLWLDALTFARDDERLATTYFDWLTAVDELENGFSVVAHLFSVTHRHHVFVRTLVTRENPVLPTATGVFVGAGWHERESHEMFGVVFDGHPLLAPLLLPENFDGHPLRKDFVLASRVAKEWPGSREPGETHGGGPKRAKMRPPGVPEPGTWGPESDGDAEGDATAESEASE